MTNTRALPAVRESSGRVTAKPERRRTHDVDPALLRLLPRHGSRRSGPAPDLCVRATISVGQPTAEHIQDPVLRALVRTRLDEIQQAHPGPCWIRPHGLRAGNRGLVLPRPSFLLRCADPEALRLLKLQPRVAVLDILHEAACEAVSHQGERLPPLLDRFLQEILGLQNLPKDQSLIWEAIFRVIGRSARWLEIPPGKVFAYLRVAIGREAWRLHRHQEEHNRLWNEAEQWQEEVQEDLPSLPLAKAIETVFPRLRLRRVIDALRQAGRLTPKQEALLERLEAGDSPAEALRAIRGTWSNFQGLQRKIQRHFRKLA